MKFYVAKSLSVMSNRGTRHGYDPTYYFNFVNVTADLQCFLPSDNTKLVRLKQSFKEPLRSWQTNVTVKVSNLLYEDKNFRNAAIVLEDELLNELSGHYCTGKTTVKLLLRLKETTCTLETKDIEFVCGKLCEDSTVEFPVNLLSTDAEYQRLNAYLTILVTIPEPTPDETLGSAENEITDIGSLTRCMLEQETLSDVTIVTGDDTKIKAHKVFLAFHSPVFQTMFQTEMIEAKKNIVKIPEMLEKSVRAFLKFLYYRDTEDAVNDCVIAFQLYYAGNKYDIKMLEDDMNALILNQPCEWFKDTDVAVQLFGFARNLIPANKPLLHKAIQILKHNSANLGKSPTFHKLFKRNAAAMDLCLYALII